MTGLVGCVSMFGASVLFCGLVVLVCLIRDDVTMRIVGVIWLLASLCVRSGSLWLCFGWSIVAAVGLSLSLV